MEVQGFQPEEDYGDLGLFKEKHVQQQVLSGDSGPLWGVTGTLGNTNRLGKHAEAQEFQDAINMLGQSME